MTIKKLTSVLLALLMILVPIIANAEEITDADFVFDVRSVNAELDPGETVTVDVAAVINTGYAYGAVKVEWDDSALELVDVKYTSLAPDNNSSAISGSGSYTVRFGDYMATSDKTGTGVLFSLVFEIDSYAEEESYPIRLSGMELYSASGSRLQAYALTGAVNLSEYEDKDLILEGGSVTADSIGATVDVPVTATYNAGYRRGSLMVSWDEDALQLTDVKYTTSAPKNGSAAISNTGSYTVKFGGSLTYSETGTFFTLKFKVKSGATNGKYAIGLGNAEVFAPSGDRIATSLTSGSVTVSAHRPIYVPTEAPTAAPTEYSQGPAPTEAPEDEYSGKSGVCDWSFNKNTGTLTISGSGAMKNYGDSSYVPWTSRFGDKIKSVVISDGVTKIGSYAFSGLSKLTSVSISSTVKTVEDYAFLNTGLKSVTVPAGVTDIENAPFGYNSSGIDLSTGEVKLKKVSGFVIKGANGSEAQTYATENGFTFSGSGGVEPTQKPTEPAAEILLGDADGDGEVTILDATAIQRKLAGLPTAFVEAASDADEDGEVSILDATEIQRFLVGLSTNGKRINQYI